MNLISSAATFIKQEFFRVLPPTIYFLVAFNIVVLTTAMVLKEFEVHISGHAAATILALVVGKVVLVVDKVKYVRRFDSKPLVYPVFFKAIIYIACRVPVSASGALDPGPTRNEYDCRRHSTPLGRGHLAFLFHGADLDFCSLRRLFHIRRTHRGVRRNDAALDHGLFSRTPCDASRSNLNRCISNAPR